MMNRPNLPPLRLALAQCDDRDHSNRDTPHRSGYSTRLHSDLSFYSLASSSTPPTSSSSSHIPSPKRDLLPSFMIENLGFSSLKPSINHSERRSSGSAYRTSGSRQHNYIELKDNLGHDREVQPEKNSTRGISPWEKSNPQFFRSYRTTQSENTGVPHDKPMSPYHSECHTVSGGIPFNRYERPELEVNKTSKAINSQLPPNLSDQSANLEEPQYGCAEPGGRPTQEGPEISPSYRVQPTETASGTRYFCPVWGCGKSFTRNFNLTQHISAIHKDERRFQCTYCMALFYRRNDLTRHERAHTGVRPYQCECGQNFTRTDLLARHKHSGNCAYKKKS
ncbi:hypothetical protein PGTUg99_010035 [Puccinia graminis f. sp. tritici]|uniref:C2H2-type domain-containing protein n=1 Tax=Puccinia graminis f. sp. tritici TaxID=56615 RepID=A0A5B0R5D2_PUCGR|nr:hypothetical protein PGTUg99_010035 [Puccinia graminis f. sp. tritici]